MDPKDRFELDQWIAEHVMGVSPRIEAAAMDESETGMALWETDLITKQAVRDFCIRTPQYHYVERKKYPLYSRNGYEATEVLKKCAEKLGTDGYEISIGNIITGINERRFMVCTSSRRGHQVLAETLELAICLFAKEMYGPQVEKILHNSVNPV